MVCRSSIFHIIQPKAAVKQLEYGRGNRVRKQVNYCDDLTDEQFMRICEDDDDMEDDNESSLVAVPDSTRRRKGRARMSVKESSKSVRSGEMDADYKDE